MKIVVSFELGSYSTKVSYHVDKQQHSIKTIEFQNVLLFKSANKVLIGHEALQKLKSNKKKYQNQFCQNFTSNMLIQNGKYFDEQERDFTITDNLLAKNIMFFPDIQLEVSLKKIFILFLREIKKQIQDNFKQYQQTEFETIVAIDMKDSIYQQNTLKYCFAKSGFESVRFCLKSHALSFQYQISNNMICNKRVLFCDIGNSGINFYISRIDVGHICIEKEFYFKKGLKFFDLTLLKQVVEDLFKKCQEDISQNQFNQYLLFEQIQQLKKSFQVNSEILFDISKIIDGNLQNQYVKICEEIYIQLNQALLKEFEEFVQNVIDQTQRLNLFIQDIQIVGGGSAMKVFQKIIKDKFENKYIFDKLNKYYSISEGGCFYDQFKDKISFINHKKIVLCQQDKDKTIKEQVLFDRGEKIIINQNSKKIQLENELQKDQILTIKYKKNDKKRNQNLIFEIQQEGLKEFNLNHNGYLLFNQFEINNHKTDIEIIEKYQEFNLSLMSQSKSEQQYNEKLLFNNSQTKEDTVSSKHSCHSKHAEHSCHSKHSHSSTHSHDQKNSLFGSAQMHILSDFIQDIFLLVLSFAILLNPKLSFLDPYLSIVISAVVVYFVGKYTFQLFEKLLEVTPAEINYTQILNELLQVKGVMEIHDLHVWELGTMKYAGSVHLVANKEHKRILKETTMIFRKHKIYHSTVQMESPMGKKDELYINCDNNIHVK